MSEEEPRRVVRVTMDVPADVYAAWKLLSIRQGVSLAEAHRRMVAESMFIEGQVADGNTFFVGKPETGSVREVIFPSTHTIEPSLSPDDSPSIE